VSPKRRPGAQNRCRAQLGLRHGGRNGGYKFAIHPLETATGFRALQPTSEAGYKSIERQEDRGLRDTLKRRSGHPRDCQATPGSVTCRTSESRLQVCERRQISESGTIRRALPHTGQASIYDRSHIVFVHQVYLGGGGRCDAMTIHVSRSGSSSHVHVPHVLHVPLCLKKVITASSSS